MKITYGTLLTVGALVVSVDASAASLIYTGKNPHITPTANPYNSASIEATAALNRPKEKRDANAGRLSESDLIRSSVVSSISARYNSILTGNTSGNGTLNFGDGGTAEYSTLNGVRTITFRNVDGTSTTLSFPL